MPFSQWTSGNTNQALQLVLIMYFQCIPPRLVHLKAFGTSYPSTALYQSILAPTVYIPTDLFSYVHVLMNFQGRLYGNQSPGSLSTNLFPYYTTRPTHTAVRNCPHSSLLPFGFRIRKWKRSRRMQEMVKTTLASTSKIRDVERVWRLCTDFTMASVDMVLPNYMVYKITGFRERQAG